MPTISKLHLLLAILTPGFGLPDGECQREQQTCRFDESVISIEPSVLTLRECRQLCRESSACTHVTHFGPGEFELVNTCVLFSSCDFTLPCIDCIGEDTTRPCTTCSSPVVEANIGGANNMLDFLPNIDEETGCWVACREEARCKYYTHHSTSHPTLPNTCFLFSHLEGKVRQCEHCATGAWDCNPQNTCKLLNDTVFADDNIIVTSSTVVSALVLGSTSSCSLSILAVGAGGKGSCSTGGGGGSGFVEMTTVNVEHMEELVVHVGGASNLLNISQSPHVGRSTNTNDYSGASAVIMQGFEVIVAEPGDMGEIFTNTNDTSTSTSTTLPYSTTTTTTTTSTTCGGVSGAGNGGRGYSGGGGYGDRHGGNGGSNGRDGSNGYMYEGSYGQGGEGTGTRLEEFNMPTFSLKSGSAGSNDQGKYHTKSNGGGGGGVLVDGEGPRNHYDCRGDGYGGGGGGDCRSGLEGLPGVVLIAVN